MASNDVEYRLLGDPKSAVRAFDKTGDAGDKMSGRLATALGGLVAGAGFAAIADQALGLATELSGLQTKSETVFAGSLGDVQGWADSVKRNFGLSQTEVVGLATNMGDLLKPMGFTAEEAAGMSTDVLGLAGALSEWTGGTQSVAEVSDILTKAMLGERDSLKALGISINQAEVDQAALAIAQADGRDAITDMDKALATQQLVMEKSTDAQDAYAEGGNKLLRAQNSVSSAVKDVRDKLVLALVPAMERAVEIGGQMISWARENKDILAVVGGAIAAVAGAQGLVSLARGFQAAKTAAFGLNAVLAINPFVLVIAAVAALAAGLVIAYRKSETFRNIVQSVWEWIQKAADVVVDFAESALEKAKGAFEALKPTIERVLDVFRNVIDFVVGVFTRDWDKALDALLEIAKAVFDGIREAFGKWKELMSAAVEAAGSALAKVGPILWDWMIEGFKALPGLIVDAIGFVGDLLIDVGKQLIDGIVDGIKAAPSAILDAIQSLIPGAGLVGEVAGRIGGFLGFAQGGVVQPNSPFLGVLGDNRREPEVISPVSTMRAALAAELAANGGAGGGTQTVVIQLGDTVLDRILLDASGRVQRTTGQAVSF